MKTLVFDTSSIITLATNSLLPTIKPLYTYFKGDFLIPEEVKKELVDNPLKNKKYSLEAMIVLKSIELDYLKIDHRKIKEDLLKLANSIFKSNKRYIQVLHQAECDALSLALRINAEAYVVDERSTRLIIENPNELRKLLENKLHTKITIEQENLKRFKKLTKDIKIIRSSELMMVALEKGLLDKYLPQTIKKKEIIAALLWALRLNGCALSTNEINELITLTK